MNSGIKIFVLALQVLKTLSTVDESKYPRDCGVTPMYRKGLIVGGNIIEPDEYSWIANLQYGNRHTFGHCGGSVINSWYVLTAAHCVTGREVDNCGGLTGVRLGDFTQEPYCDYGTPNCTSYLHFGIAEKIVHEHYNNRSYFNDIALLRLNSRIPFNSVLKPVCLPDADVSEPENEEQLTVSGWGITLGRNEQVAKRAVSVPLTTDPNVCAWSNGSTMCAGVPSNILRKAKTSCDGDSGGPLMQQCLNQKMVIEGIVSSVRGSSCVNKFMATQYTRVRHYLNWIDKHMCMGHECQTNIPIKEKKFPTDCGYINAGNNRHSWIVSFMRGQEITRKRGAVINSRYVLKAAHLMDIRFITGVALGVYDVNGDICDNRNKNCAHYEEYGIEKIIKHRNFYVDMHDHKLRLINNIALIRLDRAIEFGPKMKPICLPFGGKHIPEPPLGSNLTVPGRESDINVTLHKREMCDARFLWSDETMICTVSEDFIEPYYLVHQFEHQRVVLEGIYSDATIARNSTGIFLYKLLFTAVRNYSAWLDEHMEM